MPRQHSACPASAPLCSGPPTWSDHRNRFYGETVDTEATDTRPTDDFDAPVVRRRQPLLRGARRLHPPPRPGARRRGACSGARSTAASTTCSAAGSATPSPTRRSTRSPSRAPCTTTSGATPTAATRSSSSPSASRSAPSTATATPASRTLDEQGLDGCWLFPTLGMIYEEPLKRRSRRGRAPRSGPSTGGSHEDWGFDYQDRIFAAPYLTLADLDWAVEELQWALDNGARTIVMRPAAPTTDDRAALARSTTDVRPLLAARSTRPASPSSLHAGDGGVSSNGYAVDGFAATLQAAAWQAVDQDRSPSSGPSTTTCSRSSSTSIFVPLPQPAHRVGRERRRVPARPVPQAALDGPQDARATSPTTRSTSFREHVWINPFWEDDVDEVVELMGADRVIFGSDWPHIEGLPEPARLPARAQGRRRRRRPQAHPPRQRPRAHRAPPDLTRHRCRLTTAATSARADRRAGCHLGLELLGRQRRRRTGSPGPGRTRGAAASRAARRSRPRPPPR